MLRQTEKDRAETMKALVWGLDLMLDDQWVGVGCVRGQGELGDETRVDGRVDDLKTYLEISLPSDF